MLDRTVLSCLHQDLKFGLYVFLPHEIFFYAGICIYTPKKFVLEFLGKASQHSLFQMKNSCKIYYYPLCSVLDSPMMGKGLRPFMPPVQVYIVVTIHSISSLQTGFHTREECRARVRLITTKCSSLHCSGKGNGNTMSISYFSMTREPWGSVFIHFFKYCRQFLNFIVNFGRLLPRGHWGIWLLHSIPSPKSTAHDKDSLKTAADSITRRMSGKASWTPWYHGNKTLKSMGFKYWRASVFL